MNDKPRLIGRMDRWIAQKGFGFIRPDEGGKTGGGLFCHIRDIAGLGAGETPQQGQRLSFVLDKDRDGRRRAADIRLLD
jgi:cold shock CspA family protein